MLWTVVSLAAGLMLGTWGFVATAAAVVLAWGYSMPPFRFKQNGWIGNLAVGISYEGLAWVTGAAVALGGALPPAPVLVFALLYSLGAHGIMTLNDFKSREGDLRMGVDSIPALHGAKGAAVIAAWTMLVPQLFVVEFLIGWGALGSACAVMALVVVQGLMLRKLIAEPTPERALWHSGFGVPLFVAGMMVTAFALRGGIL